MRDEVADADAAGAVTAPLEGMASSAASDIATYTAKLVFAESKT